MEAKCVAEGGGTRDPIPLGRSRETFCQSETKFVYDLQVKVSISR